MSRNRLWLIVGVVFAAALALGSWSWTASTLLIVACLAAGLGVALKRRPTTGPYSFSTTCAHCGALLQAHAGLPERVCSTCGERQPWAR
jgi:hypothetical protein